VNKEEEPTSPYWILKERVNLILMTSDILMINSSMVTKMISLNNLLKQSEALELKL
jgi:hypothetical protein